MGGRGERDTDKHRGIMRSKKGGELLRRKGGLKRSNEKKKSVRAEEGFATKNIRADSIYA